MGAVRGVGGKNGQCKSRDGRNWQRHGKLRRGAGSKGRRAQLGRRFHKVSVTSGRWQLARECSEYREEGGRKQKSELGGAGPRKKRAGAVERHYTPSCLISRSSTHRPAASLLWGRGLYLSPPDAQNHHPQQSDGLLDDRAGLPASVVHLRRRAPLAPRGCFMGLLSLFCACRAGSTWRSDSGRPTVWMQHTTSQAVPTTKFAPAR